MLSIIIINYNTYNLTCECIRSVMDNTSIPHEIIIVDNGSDECKADLFQERFPNIILVKSEQNLGFSRGNNLGIMYTKGDYILLLNSDTKLINNAIDVAFMRIKCDKSIGALTSQLISPDGSLQQASNRLMPMYKLIGSALKLHKIFPIFIEKQPNLDVEHFSQAIWGTFFMFPKKILSFFPNGKLTETFFMYGEDTEWSFYIRSNGFRLLYYPNAKILHYGGSSARTTSDEQWANGIINEYRLLNIMHGKLYSTFYFLSKALFYTSCFDKKLFSNAKKCFAIALNGLSDHIQPQ